MNHIQTNLLNQGLKKCLKMLQRVNKRSYWALQTHINVDILDKAFKVPKAQKQSDSSDEGSDNGEQEDSDDELDGDEMVNVGEEESKTGNAAGPDNSKIPLDPVRLNEFS